MNILIGKREGSSKVVYGGHSHALFAYTQDPHSKAHSTFKPFTRKCAVQQVAVGRWVYVVWLDTDVLLDKREAQLNTTHISPRLSFQILTAANSSYSRSGVAQLKLQHRPIH